MIETKWVGDFGEMLCGMFFRSHGFKKCDHLDAEGIDIAAYNEEGVGYGISVKTRAPLETPNNSLNLKWNDIAGAYLESKLRGLIPIYMVIWYTKEGIDMICMTQEYFLKSKGYVSIDEYLETYPDRNAKQATKSFPTNQKQRDKWLEYYHSGEKGILYATRWECKQ